MTIAALPIAIPLVVAAALAATDMVTRRWMADVAAVATAAATTTLCAILLVRSFHGPIVYWMGGWRPAHSVALGISLTIDSLGAGLAVLTGALVTAALVFSSRYFEAVGTLFHALMLVFMAAMVGFCLTGDLFNLFVFFELMSGAAYALTAYKIEERGPLQGAINFAVTNSVGAFTILIGIGMLYARTGALNLAQIGQALAGHHADLLVVVALLLITLGFLTKAAAVPVHFWLADAHAVAPVPVCVLFSGVMVELGLYAVARIYWAGFSSPLAAHAHDLQVILVWLGVITALVGAGMCFGQRHLKRLLAFSTVSHVGLFLVGIGLLSQLGLAGTATYVLGHGLAKAALFMAVGVLLHRFASVDEHELRGRGRERSLLPVAAVCLAGGLVVAGTPVLSGFFGKSLIEEASLRAGYSWLPAVFLVASAFTGGAVLRFTGRIFAGWGPSDPPDRRQEAEGEQEEYETMREHDRAPAFMVVPAVVLAAGALVVGLVPGVVHGIERAAAHFRDRPGYAARVLHGLHPVFADAHPSHLKVSDFLLGGGSLAGALGLAALGLFGRDAMARLPARLRTVAAAPWHMVRELHSGEVGDYVAWLTAGLAGLGAAFALTLH